jgi:lipid A 3-O-deacylase
VRSVAFSLSAALMAALIPSPAQAGEIFGGAYVHDVDTPLTKSGFESGMDLQIGWRGDRIGSTVLQPYAFVSAHTEGETHFAVAGLSAKFGDRIFIRPGVGLAVHTGSAGNFQRTDRIAFGSRVLFAPELAIGAEINERMSIEASWVHFSHAQIFGRQNPGMDSLGVRLTVDLP